MKIVEKLKAFVEKTANSVHYDTTKLDTGTEIIEHGILTLETLVFLLNKKALVMGNPGTGKTSSVNKLASLLVGIPLPLAESIHLRGNPEETKESLIGRPDFGKLNLGDEKALFIFAHFFPYLLIDELNRLKPGKQSLLLQGLQSGIWKYLNDYIKTGDRPVFATANHTDEGTEKIIPPLEDRFNICFEIPPLKTTYDVFDVEAADTYARNLLSNDEIEEKMLKILLDNKKPNKEKQIEISRLCREFQDYLKKEGVFLLSEEDKKEIKRKIEETELSTHCKLYIEAVFQEINYSELYGFKRASDPIILDTTDKNYAGGDVGCGLGNRAVVDMWHITKIFAFLSGCEEANVEHAKMAIPYVLNHRLKFTADFEARSERKSRKEMKQLGLTRILLEEINARFNQEAKNLQEALYWRKEKGIKKIEDLPDRIKEKLKNTKYPPLVVFRDLYFEK